MRRASPLRRRAGLLLPSGCASWLAPSLAPFGTSDGRVNGLPPASVRPRTFSCKPCRAPFWPPVPKALAFRLEAHDPERAAMHRLPIGSVLQRCPKLERFWRHEAEVVHVEFAPDGQRALTASADSARTAAAC